MQLLGAEGGVSAKLKQLTETEDRVSAVVEKAVAAKVCLEESLEQYSKEMHIMQRLLNANAGVVGMLGQLNTTEEQQDHIEDWLSKVEQGISREGLRKLKQGISRERCMISNGSFSNESGAMHRLKAIVKLEEGLFSSESGRPVEEGLCSSKGGGSVGEGLSSSEVVEEVLPSIEIDGAMGEVLSRG